MEHGGRGDLSRALAVAELCRLMLETIAAQPLSLPRVLLSCAGLIIYAAITAKPTLGGVILEGGRDLGIGDCDTVICSCSCVTMKWQRNHLRRESLR